MRFTGLTRNIRLTLCLLFCGLSSPAVGFDLVLQLQDESGQPVGSAVVEIPGRQQETAPEEIAIIDQVDRRFVPLVIAITEGQRVNFPNSDNVRHHVYSFSAIRQFSTELFADEPIDPIRFDQSGIAVLGCNIHDSMVAYVFVSPWQDIMVSHDDGMIRLPGLDEAPKEITIWHPWLENFDNTHTVDSSDWESGREYRITLPVREPEREIGFRALTD